MSKITPLKTSAELAILRQFEEAVGTLPGTVAVRDLREAAIATIAAIGLPHRRIEEWKYTDLKALVRETKPLSLPTSTLALAALVEGRAPADDRIVRLMIIDGVYRPDLSDIDLIPAGVTVTSFAAALDAGREDVIARLAGPTIAQGNAAMALNAAFMRDGVVIEIAEDVAAARILEIAHVITGSDAVSVHSRSLVLAGKGASAGVAERFEAGNAGHQQTSVLHVVVGDGARVEHQVSKTDDASALNLATLTLELGAGSRFESCALVTSGLVSRRQYFVRCSGDHADLSLKGASLLNGRMHADTTLVVDHDSLHCASRELFRQVIEDEAHGVFQGKVIVRPGAQKTDGKMASNTLLLSADAEMDNKPELEIYADDVACGHGATCGEIDETPIFYLMSRGLPRAEAESLLIQSFVGEVIDGVGDGPLGAIGDDLRAAMTDRIETWLAARASLGSEPKEATS